MTARPVAKLKLMTWRAGLAKSLPPIGIGGEASDHPSTPTVNGPVRTSNHSSSESVSSKSVEDKNEDLISDQHSSNSALGDRDTGADDDDVNLDHSPTSENSENSIVWKDTHSLNQEPPGSVNQARAVYNPSGPVAPLDPEHQ